ncbi:cyclic GMP-AMP synthase-like [Dendrobates tinctorius]|uniref:cyclic GMP-AMP synthase-like n=1 Tax=Dendrobates tinctorius TaxID=92724 RepID=UPI003CC97473
MDDSRQSDQHEEMATRPKEPRGRGRPARSSVQTGNAAKMKTDSEKPEKYTSSEVGNKDDGHSSGRKTLQKSPTEERGKNEPTEESNHPTIKSARKQRDTPAKKEKDRETSPEGHNMTAQLAGNVNNLPNGYSEITHDSAKDKSSKVDRPQRLSHAKCKSLDEICENGQQQAKVALAKKMCDNRSKEEKNDISILDKGNTEPKRNDLKTASSRTPRRMKDLINGKLRMKMEDISKAAEKVNKVVSTILKSKEFQGDPLFKDIKKLSTGSYYERVKISKPNEFDIMLEISVQSYNTILLTILDKKWPFYTLAFKGRSPSAMEEYIEERDISANKIMKKFRELIKKIVKDEMEDVTVQRKDPGSPAVTISIRNEPQDISVDLVIALKIINRWPEETKSGMNIDDWLGMKVKLDYKRSHFYMVPKRAIFGNRTQNADTWRISFSNIEKEILSNHGNGKTCCESGGSKKEMCCRKQCLKLLKYLLELFKENGKQRKMDQFCSYHAKTALLHLCAKYPKDEAWKLEDLESCFDRYVSFFQDCLRNHTLENFFLPSHNLFSAESVSESNCDYLYREIEKQRTHDYPMFND